MSGINPVGHPDGTITADVYDYGTAADWQAGHTIQAGDAAAMDEASANALRLPESIWAAAEARSMIWPTGGLLPATATRAVLVA